MDKHSSTIKSRQDKIKNWLKDPYNLGLVGVIALSLVIRIYYLIYTKGQTLWWDEAEYLSLAKHWAFNVPFDFGPARPPLFQFLSALSFMMGLGEQFIKFVFVVIPSAAISGAVYYLGKEMFNKKIGLIAAFLSAVSWTLVFWTSRQQPDFLSMFFSVLSFTFMWRYWKQPNRKDVILAGIFAAAGLYFKVSALLVPIVFMVFIFAKDRFVAFKMKDYYIFSAAFLLTLLPYFIWGQITFGAAVPFFNEYSDQVVDPNEHFAWYSIDFLARLTTNGLGFNTVIQALFSSPIKAILASLLLISFLVGLVKAMRCLLYADILVKEGKRWFDARTFSFLAIVVITAFYIFWIKALEDRWVFLWLPFIFFLIGDALSDLENYLSKHSTYLATGAIVVILLLGGFSQLQNAHNIVESRKGSYGPVRDAGIWIKQHSNPGDPIASISHTQTVYYTERQVINFAHIRSSTEFETWLKENKPAYLIHSVFEPIVFDPRMSWLQTYFQTNQTLLKPVQVYFEDAAQTKPVLIVFQGTYG